MLLRKCILNLDWPKKSDTKISLIVYKREIIVKYFLAIV